MADPFPDEATVADTENMTIIDEEISLDKLVYPASRYNEHHPRPIYIPSRYLMIKMIKSCMGCRTKDDLWFN